MVRKVVAVSFGGQNSQPLCRWCRIHIFGEDGRRAAGLFRRLTRASGSRRAQFREERCPYGRALADHSFRPLLPTENVRSMRLRLPARSLTETTSLPRSRSVIGFVSFSSQTPCPFSCSLVARSSP